MYCLFQERTDKRFVEKQHHFSVLVLEIAGDESEYSIGSFTAFLCLLLSLEVFGDDDYEISLLFSYWQLLVGHGVVAIYIAVSNEHHCAFANTKFHLPLVGQIFRLVDVFSKLYYVVWVTCFVAEFAWCYQRIWILFLLTMVLFRSLIFMRNSSGPRTLPCGTPDVTGVKSLWVWLMQTL